MPRCQWFVNEVGGENQTAISRTEAYNLFRLLETESTLYMSMFYCWAVEALICLAPNTSGLNHLSTITNFQLV